MFEKMTLIDQNETEKLYKLENNLFNTVILVCNGEEFCLGDMQSNDQPRTLKEAAEYTWYPLTDIANWHS